MNSKDITESSFESPNPPQIATSTQEPSEVRLEQIHSSETEPSDLRRDVDNLLALNRNQSEQLTSLANRLQHQKQSVTYGGIFSLLALMTSLGVAASWLLLEFLPPEILTRINGRVNNNAIRLQRIERQLNTSPQP
jgi:hypothetical protein